MKLLLEDRKDDESESLPSKCVVVSGVITVKVRGNPLVQTQCSNTILVDCSLPLLSAGFCVDLPSFSYYV